MSEATQELGGVFPVTIVTPSGTRVEYNVRHLRAPGVEGDFGVLRGHIPFMTALRPGALVLDGDQGRQVWAVSGGYAEVLSDQVTILAEAAERFDQIDVERARAAAERARKRLQSPGPDIDLNRARAALNRALNRIKVAAGQV